MQFGGFYLGMSRQDGTKINQRKENELERKRTCLCLSGGRDHSRLTLHLRLNLHPTCCCLNACTYTVYILKFKSSTHLENCCRGTLSLSLMARDSLMCLFLSFAWCLTRTLNPGFQRVFYSEKQQPVNHSVRKLSVDECQNTNWNEKTLSDNLLEILLRVPWPRKGTIAGNYRRDKKTDLHQGIMNKTVNK